MRKKLIRVVSFILLFSCISLLLVGCDGIPDGNFTDKESLINLIKQDFISSEGSEATEFTAHTFAIDATLDSSFSIDVKIIEDEIYLNDVLYETVKVVDYPKLNYNKLIFIKSKDSAGNKKIAEIFNSILSSESCYMLETESTATGLSKKMAVYIIDRTYCIVSFSESNELIRIHYANRTSDAESKYSNTKLYEAFDTIKEDSAHNNKICICISFEDLYYELKNSILYENSEWKNSVFIVTVTCIYDKAINEAWYKECTQTDTKSLNEAFYNHYSAGISKGSYLNTHSPGMHLIYNSLENFNSDYAAIKALADLDYVTQVYISYNFGLPRHYFME